MSTATRLERLYARSPRGIRLGVETMQAALHAAGNPERGFEVVHVAGTNGKGSTCAMLEAALRAAGKRVGLYTSPHLVRFAERIRVEGAALTDAALEAALDFDAPELSFFEAATLAAFRAFRSADVELVILEVGLGGRFDATNVDTRKLACAITSIGLDHEEFLGDDIGSIAMEKSGILRSGVPCVVGDVPPAARARIEQEARSTGAPLIFADTPYPGALGLRGPHQRKNAAIAAKLAELCGVSPTDAAHGIEHATWPGRLERIEGSAGGGTVLLDGAHNPDGIAALIAALVDAGGPPPVLVFGAVSDKPALEMLDALRPHVGPCVYVAPGGKAPFDPHALAARHPGSVATSVADALVRARTLAGADALVLVAGSLYLVGEARALLLGLPSDPRVGM